MVHAKHAWMIFMRISLQILPLSVQNVEEHILIQMARVIAQFVQKATILTMEINVFLVRVDTMPKENPMSQIV